MVEVEDSQQEHLQTWLQQLLKDEEIVSDDLTDGVLISKSLNLLAPAFFDEDWTSKINKKASNWRVATNNIRKLISKLQDYYEQECQEELSDFDWPDPNAIGERKDRQQLCSLLQLVVGVVFCRKQESDIQQIQQLDQAVQKSIMNVFHELQQRLPSSCFGMVEEEGAVDSSELSLKLSQVMEANRKLEERNQMLELERNSLEEKQQELIADNDRLSSLQDVPDGRDTRDAIAANERLKEQLEELHQRVLQLSNERDEAELSREQLRKSCERHEETIGQLRQQNHDLLEEVKDDTALQDELDILRRRVRDYETQVEKYKQKLEGLSDVRHRLKASEEQRSRCEQQAKELEEKCRVSAAARSQLDMYHQKVDSLEESVSAESKRAMEAELAAKKAREKLDQAQRQLKRLEEEVHELREQNTEAAVLHEQGSSFLDSRQESSDEVAKLRAEIDLLKSSATAADFQQQIETLQMELKYRDATEDKLKKRIRAQEGELLDLQSRLEDSEDTGSASSAKPVVAKTTQEPGDSTVVADLKRVLADVRLQMKTLKTDLEQRNKKLDERNSQNNVLKDKLSRKEDEFTALLGKHKTFQEKTRSTIKVLQENHERTLQREIQERESQFKNLQDYSKQQEEKTEKVREGYDMEQRVLVSSWNRACERLQQYSGQSRLATQTDTSFLASAMPSSFLARQRQALIGQQTAATFAGTTTSTRNT